MKIALFGATGVLGRQVVPRLLERGHEVHAIVLANGAAPCLRHRRLRAFSGSILDPESFAQALAGVDAVLHLATAVPPPGPAMDWTMNDRIRRAGTRNVLDVGKRQGVPHYLFQSLAMLANDEGGRLLDEDAPARPNAVSQSALDMEGMALGSGRPVTVLRGGMFYGPGTGRMAALNAQAREGTLRYPGDGGDFVSLVHVVDMARAVVAAVEAQTTGVFNIVDDEPVRNRDLFEHIAMLHGMPGVDGGAAAVFPSFRISNARARSRLSWAPTFASYLSGWQPAG